MNRSSFAPLLLLAACTRAPTSTGAERIERVQSGLRPWLAIQGEPDVRWTLAERMKHYHVPGVAIAVIDSGRIAWAKGFGVRERGGTVPVDTATMFQAGSISKPTFAVGVMRLVQDGRLDLDQDVNQRLTSWKVPDNRFTTKERVTLRRLLSHTAGLGVHGFPGYEAGAPIPTVPQILDGEKPANTAAVRVDTVPGTRSSYSGGGTTVAMLLVTDVLGKPFPAFMRETVLGPAGMTHSTYQQPLPDSLAPLAASGHTATGDVVKGRYHTYPEMSAAGLWTTPVDLARLAIELIRTWQGESSRIIDRKTLTEMATIQGPSGSSFGIGYEVSGAGRDLELAHGGADVGFRADFVVFPARGQGAVIMTNGDNGSELIAEVMAAIADEYRWPSHHPVPKTLVRKTAEQLAPIAGEYSLDIGRAEPAVATVSIEGGRVYLSVAGGLLDRTELLADSDSTFFTREAGVEVRFERDRTGPVTGIVIEGSVRGRKTKSAPPAAASDSGTAPDGAPALAAADLETWLDGFFSYALEQGDIAGAVVLVVKNGKVLLEKGYGSADRARSIPMDPERTIVGVGSVSKLFTWTAVMQQVERGKLDLDRDVNAYLDFTIPPAFGRPITLRNLMTHSAGFEEREFRELSPTTRARDLGDYLRQTPVPDRIFPPGEVEAYSNYGAMIAGYAVERVSGLPFVDYIEREILAPLGMNHSTFRRPIPESIARDLARHYGLASEPPLRPDNEEPAGDPSGHLLTTASDMSRFILAHLDGGRYGDVTLLRPETMKSMHAPAFTPLPGANPVTLGFFRTDYNGHRILTHGGDVSGFHADVELLPDDSVGFFMAVNSDGASHGVLSASNSLRSSLFHRFLDRYFPAPPAPEQSTTATAKEHARLAAGEYRFSRRWAGDFKVAANAIRMAVIKPDIVANEDGTIGTPALLDFEQGRAQRWREVGPFLWREVGGRALLNMKVENGKVTAWFPKDLYSFVMEPVPPGRSAETNVRLLLLAAVGLLIMTLLWPIGSLVRRRYGRSLELEPREAAARRLSLVAGAVGVAYLAGWVPVLVGDLGSRAGIDPLVRGLQIVGLVCVAGAVAALWNVWVTWTGKRRDGWARLGSLVTALALVDVVWFSFAFDLITPRLNY